MKGYFVIVIKDSVEIPAEIIESDDFKIYGKNKSGKVLLIEYSGNEFKFDPFGLGLMKFMDEVCKEHFASEYLKLKKDYIKKVKLREQYR